MLMSVPGLPEVLLVVLPALVLVMVPTLSCEFEDELEVQAVSVSPNQTPVIDAHNV
jgi:hypothetical protein